MFLIISSSDSGFWLILYVVFFKFGETDGFTSFLVFANLALLIGFALLSFSIFFGVFSFVSYVILLNMFSKLSENFSIFSSSSNEEKSYFLVASLSYHLFYII